MIAALNSGGESKIRTAECRQFPNQNEHRELRENLDTALLFRDARPPPAETLWRESEKGHFIRPWGNFLYASTASPAPRLIPKTAAVIDIGSNGIRLFIYNRSEKPYGILHNDHKPCMLADGLHTTGQLSRDGLKKAINLLESFKSDLHWYKPDIVIPIGTASLRAVQNTPQGIIDIERLQKALGHRYPINIITGQEEAFLTGWGILHGLSAAEGKIPEITGSFGGVGGASLEVGNFVIVAGQTKVDWESCRDFPVGMFPLAEKSWHNPVRATEVTIESLYASGWQSEGNVVFCAGSNFRTHRALLEGAIPGRKIGHGVIFDWADARYESMNIRDTLTNRFQALKHHISDRAETVPFAASVFLGIGYYAQPERVVMCAHRMSTIREGALLQAEL